VDYRDNRTLDRLNSRSCRNTQPEVVVILAGYPIGMNRFCDAIPGMRSRVDQTLEFPDLAEEAIRCCGKRSR
jgi:hypothetical protein